jgi:DNA-binding transcriptional ArsR family regulator
VATVIDRVRHELEERLKQLLDEADKLRRALTALDPRAGRSSRSAPSRSKSTTRKPTTRKAQSATSSKRNASATTASLRTRTAPGATKAAVLAALSQDGGKTAGEVAKATGLARGTVSTTLSKLAKAGDVIKAERGYRLP